MAEMSRSEINELRRLLNQTGTLVEAAMSLAAADEGLHKRLRGIRERVRDEQASLDERLSQLPYLPAAARAY
jgi:hypothetical protein